MYIRLRLISSLSRYLLSRSLSSIFSNWLRLEINRFLSFFSMTSRIHPEKKRSIILLKVKYLDIVFRSRVGRSFSSFRGISNPLEKISPKLSKSPFKIPRKSLPFFSSLFSSCHNEYSAISSKVSTSPFFLGT